MKKLILLSITLFISSNLLFSQDGLTPEMMYELDRVGGVEISPDGKWMLFGITDYDIVENKGNRDLYIMETDGKVGSHKKITDFDGSEFNAMWRPDGKKITFLSAKDGSVQLYEINPDGSELQQVTDVEGGISNLAYAPDMKHISFTLDIKLDKTVNDLHEDLPKADARIIEELMYRHWNQWHDYAYSHVHYMNYEDGKASGEPVDIMPGERFDSPLNPFGGGEQIAWSSDGKTIAYTCKKVNGKNYAVSTNSDLYLYNLENKQTQNLTVDNKGYDMEPIWSPDGSMLAWMSMERDGYESDKNRIFTYDLKSKKFTDLSSDVDQTCGGISWSSDSKKIFFTSPINATYQMWEVDMKKKVRQITDGIHNYRSMAAVGSDFIGVKQSMSYPYEIYRVNGKTGKDEALTAVNNEALAKAGMGKVEKRMIKTTDGKDMLVWVIYPPDFDENKKYPALLYCQGGPQSAVSQFWSYRWNFQMMASNGYIVVAPNRRGLPSFGQKWNEDISGDWGGQCMEDYLSAIDAVAAESYVDEDRLGAVGASFGGYSVYYLAGTHEKRFKTFISHCGLYNLDSWYGSTEELFFADFDLKGAYFDEPQPKSYKEFSPHNFAKNWDTPMLVIHGQQDFRVPVTQGMEAFNVLQVKEIPSKFLYFPNEGHWVQNPQNGILWQRVFFSWLDQWLKDPNDPTEGGR